MKSKDVLFVLLLGTIWGSFEATFGEVMYANHVRYTSVPLCVFAFAVLTFARAYRPMVGLATLLAGVAMCYKAAGMLLSGNDIFVCHFMGIATVGVAYDLMHLAWRQKLDPLFAVSAMYLSYGMFAALMTWVIRYHYWAEVGLPKVLKHTFVSGSMAAIAAAVVVPLCARAARKLRSRQAWPFVARFGRVATGAVTLALVGLWALGIGAYQLMALGD